MVAYEAALRPDVLCRVKLYSYFTLGAVLYGVAWAHIPPLLGQEWSLCKQADSCIGCVLTVHLFDVPPVLFNLYVAWYGLKRFYPHTVRAYASLLTFAAAFNFIFFTFEVIHLLNALRMRAHLWERVAYFTIALIVVAGVALAVYVHQVLNVEEKMATRSPSPISEPMSKGRDGFYHPSTEEQIITLVKKAYEEGLQVRCRGAAHSLAHAIYTDGDNVIPNKVSEQNPPQGRYINIMLDRYNRITYFDKEKGIIEVQAGIHLGYDPEDPAQISTLENSLLYQIAKEGWALEDLGGITHQTVSGFLSTGSSGGTLKYKLEGNLLAFRMIDGMGNAEWAEKRAEEKFTDEKCTDEKNTDLFEAVGVSFGLLGIISKVRFQLTPNFFIYGQQMTTPTDPTECPIDLFGSGTNKPSLERFLKETPYTRLLWWPQNGVERLVIWQAVRGEPLPVFDAAPYEEFSDIKLLEELEEMVGAILFTLLGNKGFFKAWWKVQKDFSQFRKNLYVYFTQTLIKPVAWLFSWLVMMLVWLVALPVALFLGVFRPVLLWLYPKIVDLLQPLTKQGKAQLFMDYMWRSLPMDNEADDILLGTEFTEIWLPIEHTEEAMRLLRDLFNNMGADAQSFYCTELYAGKKNRFWLSPSYCSDMLRVDVFWYTNNEGDPAAEGGYYSQFWELFREKQIPFRLHWGKSLPEYDYDEWAAYLRSQYPRWDDFMELRKSRDPKNIFLTDYWRSHLGIP